MPSTMPFSPEEANSLFEELPSFAATRLREISGMAQPYIEVTDRYARLVSRLVNLLGHNPPNGTQDNVVRDLMADVFDFLYEAKALIIGGKLAIAYPLARRAYESLSLLSLCALDVTWAEKWQIGKEISNRDVRRNLAKHPMGEPESEMKELYNFFCTATHPNREMICARRLGEGNEYVLGMIGMPDLYYIVDYCAKHLELLHWLTLATSYFYLEKLLNQDPTYFKEYDEVIKDGKDVKKWLVESLPNLRDEAMAIDANGGIRTKPSDG